MIRVVRDLPSNKNGGGCWDKRVYCIHFVDERELLTTELSDYNDLRFETCILEGTSYVTDRILYRGRLLEAWLALTVG